MHPFTWVQMVSALKLVSLSVSVIRSIPKRFKNSETHVSIEKHFDLWIFQFDKIILFEAKKAKRAVFPSCLVFSYAVLYAIRHTAGHGAIFTLINPEVNLQTSIQKDWHYSASFTFHSGHQPWTGNDNWIVKDWYQNLDPDNIFCQIIQTFFYLKCKH